MIILDRAVLIALFFWLIYGLFRQIRGFVHRRGLPEPSIASSQLERYQGQAFREICRRATNPGPRVGMTDYFAQRGWNRADVMRILAEPLKHELIKIKGWRFGGYAVTRKGWDEYKSKFLWVEREEAVRISADRGSFVLANLNSPHGQVHVGNVNQANVSDIPHQHLIDALRTDAATATPDEAVRAQEYADDLASAVDAQDTDRTTRILARINSLLSTAKAAFALTRQLLPPHV